LLPEEPEVFVEVAVFDEVVVFGVFPGAFALLQRPVNQLTMELKPLGSAVQAFGQTLAPPAEKGATFALAQKHAS
jgi:hypothetical protein